MPHGKENRIYTDEMSPLTTTYNKPARSKNNRSGPILKEFKCNLCFQQQGLFASDCGCFYCPDCFHDSGKCSCCLSILQKAQMTTTRNASYAAVCGATLSTCETRHSWLKSRTSFSTHHLS